MNGSQVSTRGHLKASHAAKPGKRSDVLLIAMPWHRLQWPSIQLGILQSLLTREGISSGTRALGLAFMEHCLRETAHCPEGERLRLDDYMMVSGGRHGFSLGDWIFAVPPFGEPQAASDAPYLAYLRTCRVPEPDIAKVLAMRALVPAFLARSTDEILAARPRIVGFTCTGCQTVPSLALAKALKERAPGITIVLGGRSCDGPMGGALHRAFPWVDVVVRGEAEGVLPDLLRDLLAKRPVRPQPGLCYREGGRSFAIDGTAAKPVAMDDVPPPDYDAYFEQLAKTSFGPEILTEVELPYQTARGCWWGAKSHCAFCGERDETMTFRSRSPVRTVEQLFALARRYRRLDLVFPDNILDPRYLAEVLPQVRKAGYDFRFFLETRANLTRDQLRRMRETGARSIYLGIESLSTPILRLMRKGIAAFQNVRLLKWCAQYGVEVAWRLIYGMPGEPPQEYARMAEAVHSLTHLPPPILTRLSLERFSPYHERPADFGLEVLGPMPWYGMVYPVEPPTLADLAYEFDYRYRDGRDPEAYVAPLRSAIEAWEASRPAGYRSLRYRRGPGFLVVQDRRPNLEAADYTFEGRGAQIYLACEDGATPETIARALRAAGSAEGVRAYLDELVAMRLVYTEGGRYLALALPEELSEVS